MRKFLLPIALLAIIALLTGCSSGSSTSSAPPGITPGVASSVQLVAGQTTVQTNSQVLFHAKVLDGNGNSLKNEPVIFTNISPIGTLKTPLSANAISAATVTKVVMTNSLGIATIAVFSSSDGFVTLRAEVDEAINQSSDTRTIWFTSVWPPVFTTPVTPVPIPGLDLDVEGDGDPYTVLEVLPGTADDTVTVTATVYETLGGIKTPVPNSLVTFGADVPYKIGEEGACIGGATCEVIFLFANTALTNSDGEASVSLKVSPAFERDIETLFNVTALADNGAADLVTIFIGPVASIVANIDVSANPARIDVGGSSNITARVTNSSGDPVPTGTTVSFTVAGSGAIEPFAQTDENGIVTVTFSADDIPGNKVITATSSGVQGATTVFVIASVEPPVTEGLLITPETVSAFPGDKLAFTITGGVGPYTTTSPDLTIACNSIPLNFLCDNNDVDDVDTGEWTGAIIVVTIDQLAPDGSITIDVLDSEGATTSATILIVGGVVIPGPPTVLWTIPANGATNVSTLADVIVRFSEDIEPLTLHNGSFVIECPAGTVISRGVTLDGDTATSVLPDELPATTLCQVTLTTDIRDLDNEALAADYVWTFNTGAAGPGALKITLVPTQVVGLKNVDGSPADDFDAEITGGTGPYIVSSDNAALVPGGPWTDPGPAPWTITPIDPNNVGAITSVILTVTDDLGATDSASLTIYPQTTELVISIDKPDVIGLDNAGFCSINPDLPEGGCSVDADCNEDPICSVTGAPCTVDADCFAGACSLAGTLCDVDADCPAGVCSIQATACDVAADCQIGTCTVGGASCNVDAECAVETCAAFICSISGFVCLVDTDCPGNPVNICVGGSGFVETCDGPPETCDPPGETCDLEVCVSPGDANTTDDITFSVTGGNDPYIVSDGNNPHEFDTPNTNTANDGPWAIPTDGGTYTIDPEETPTSATVSVTLTVTDNDGASADTTFEVLP